MDPCPPSPPRPPVGTSLTGDVLLKSVNKNFAKLTGKHRFIKKEIKTQVFSCAFCEIFKNIFLTGHLQVTASGKQNLHFFMNYWAVLRPKSGH